MYENPEPSDGFDMSFIPQVPKPLGGEMPPIIGSPDYIEPVAEITAPEVAREKEEAVAEQAGALAVPGALSENAQPSPQAAELGRAFDSTEEYKSRIFAEDVVASELPEVLDTSVEKGISITIKLKDSDPGFEEIRVESGQGNTQDAQPSDDASFPEEHVKTFAAFGLDVAQDQPPGFLDIRVKDGALFTRKLHELPNGDIPQAVIDGFQNFAEDFPSVVLSELHRPDFDAAKATSTQTLAYAGEICDQLSRIGVPEESLQGLRKLHAYEQEGMLTEWAEASELGLNVDLEKQPFEQTLWAKWEEPEDWEEAFAFLARVRDKHQPGGSFFPDLVNRMDANLTQVIAEQEQVGMQDDVAREEVIYEVADGVTFVADVQISSEIIAEGIAEQQTYIGLLREVQQILQEYK